MPRAALFLILIGFANSAHAGTMSFSASYIYTAHGTGWTDYPQFDPSLGTLTDVTIETAGSVFFSSGYTFRNSTNQPQNFTGTVSFSFSGDGGLVKLSDTFSGVLPPGTSVQDTLGARSYDVTTSYGNSSYWVGLGRLAANQFAGGFNGLSATSNNPNITFSRTDPSFIPWTNTGTEIVTYTYGTSASVPEPPAFVLAAIAVICLGAAITKLSLRTGQESRSQ